MVPNWHLRWKKQNIAEELAGFTGRTIDRLVDGSHRHAHRRVEEMAAACEQLRDLGVTPLLAEATRELFADLDRGPGRVPDRDTAAGQPSGLAAGVGEDG